MRVALRWLERKRFQTADQDEDPEELAMHLLGMDDELARRRTANRLQTVRDAGGEVG